MYNIQQCEIDWDFMYIYHQSKMGHLLQQNGTIQLMPCIQCHDCTPTPTGNLNYLVIIIVSNLIQYKLYTFIL